MSEPVRKNLLLLPRKIARLLLPRPLLIRLVERRNERIIHRWRSRGAPLPPPPALKQRTVIEYARKNRIETLVETGTFMGEMVQACKDHFKNIYSIELGNSLFERARRKFKRYPHIRLLHGDSGEVLPALLAAVSPPCLFWLDDHLPEYYARRYYPGEDAFQGKAPSPVLEELACIFSRPHPGHVLLIDDARLFGSPGWPSLADLRDFLSRQGMNWQLENRDDIIRIENVRAEQ
jgi:hypothetical protein